MGSLCTYIFTKHSVIDHAVLCTGLGLHAAITAYTSIKVSLFSVALSQMHAQISISMASDLLLWLRRWPVHHAMRVQHY